MDTPMARADGWLESLRIAAPCAERWDAMQGDDRARHCERCALSVYNVAGLTRAEAEALIRGANGGRVCLRLLRRRDGTVLTADCPVGLAARARRRVVAAVAAVVGLLAAGVGYAASAGRTGSSTRVGSPGWTRGLPQPLRWVLQPLDEEPEILMGAVAFVPPTVPVPVPGPESAQ
jgi:hypothetical protein